MRWLSPVSCTEKLRENSLFMAVITQSGKRILYYPELPCQGEYWLLGLIHKQKQGKP